MRCAVWHIAILFFLIAALGCAHAAPACPSDNNYVTADAMYYGQECSVDDADTNGGVISVLANNVTVDCNGMKLFGASRGSGIVLNGTTGVVIKNCGIGDYNVGIYLHSAANDANIFDNNIQTTNFGVYLLGSTDANIHDNNIDTNNMYGIYLANDSNGASIMDNNIHDNNSYGIYLNRTGDSNISQNDTNDGIYLLRSSSNRITDNNILDCSDDGIYIHTNSGSNQILDNNIVFDNAISAVGGIRLNTASTDNNISDNRIRDSSKATGITLSRCGSGTLVTGNKISGLTIGNAISIAAACDGVSIADNNFSGIGAAAISIASGSNDHNILRNEISYNTSSATDIRGNDITIQDNNVVRNTGGWGIGIEYAAASGILIKDNNIVDNNLSSDSFAGAITLYHNAGYINDINITGNSIIRNDDGIGMMLVRDIILKDNNVWGNRGNGLYFRSAFDVNCEGTTVNESGTDLFFQDANIMFIDGNYLTTNISDYNSRVTRAWYIDVNAVNRVTNTPISSATVGITDSDSADVGTLTTTGDGNITTWVLTQFEKDKAGTTTKTAHSIDVNKSGFDSNTGYSVTMDQNQDLTIYLNIDPPLTISYPTAGQTTTNPSVTLSYSTATELTPVSKYWVRVDGGDWIDNGTATNYTTTLTSGSHSFTVRAMGSTDENSDDVNISFRIELAPGVAGCGDGECTAGEDACNCSSDCSAVCGDGCCTHTESSSTCRTDCLSACGDGYCDEAAGEACGTCQIDCGTCTEPPPEPPPVNGNGPPPPWQPPRPPGGPICAGIVCNDLNPCTTDLCFEGECTYTLKQDGTTCGFGLECSAGTCMPVMLIAAGLPRIPVVTEITTLLVSVLGILGGEALEKAPLAFALLIALAVIASLLAYNRLRIFIPAATVSTRRKQAMLAVRIGVSIAFFVVPFVANRMADVNIAIVAAILEIIVILLAHYAKKRSMERKAIRA